MKRPVLFFSIGLIVTILLISFSRNAANDRMREVSLEVGNNYLEENGLKNFNDRDGSNDLYMLHVYPKVKEGWRRAKLEAEVYGSIFFVIIGLILGIYWRRVSYDDVVAMALPSLIVVLINVASMVIIFPFLIFLACIWIYKKILGIK